MSRKDVAGCGKASPPKEDISDSQPATEPTSTIPPVKSSENSGTLLPRPKRRRKRSRADRGLPPDEQLVTLVRVYLHLQRKHWPEMVKAGLLPEASEVVVRAKVEDFKHRHRAGKVDVDEVKKFLAISPKLGGAYNRFSCDNSNPLSIPDQLAKILEKAKSEGRFIPWSYVFADYSVTGLDAARQGYSSYKSVLSEPRQLLDTTYIDDFTRASRDELEWWKLAALSKKLNKRMIGASDSFDLSGGNWDIMVTVFGLLSRMFIKGLREKVRRGMKGAASRKTCLGKLSLGFTRREKQDAQGNVVTGPDGLPIYEPCVDPVSAPYRRLIFELFLEKGWSCYKIAKHFCTLQIEGWNGWTEANIKSLLKNPSAIGVFIWNKTRREFDYEEEKWVVVKNPRSEWVVVHSPDLALVPMEQWKAARKKLSALRRASPITGRDRSRNNRYPSTLFSGTLFCEYCGQDHGELKLIRSVGNYKQMGCLSGINGQHGCKLTCSKSLRHIEECLLGFLRDNLLNDTVVAEIVARANDYLQAEACKPTIDIGKLKAKVRQQEKAIAKFTKLIEDTDDSSLTQGYHVRTVQLQKELNQVRSEIQRAEGGGRQPPKPLTVARASEYLKKLRELLNQEIAVAADAIRQLTGPIKIRQEPIPGKKRGARWIATISPDILGALRLVAGEEIPTTGGGKLPPLEVVIEKVPAYEALAPKFKALREKGASVRSIAAAHKMCAAYAEQILQYAETGERPKWRSVKSSDRTDGEKRNPMRYKEIAEQVAELREQRRMTFTGIAKELKVSYSTVVRAYDFARPDAVAKAAEEGEKPLRGKFSIIGQEKVDQIRELLKRGKTISAIAKEVGCGSSSVGRERQKLVAEGWQPR